ncbi:ABC transporter substrate-binding protein [Sphingomonas endolithica]|uniref:ABC transporter substrate-binding protein n=1 Tax=Sphingomonas endolithica TaxID=2972485 RepID=UPI0021AFE768|nr:ABC transporter substrate-binding protein [Sphingomonas sp. ZFBP2030]
MMIGIRCAPRGSLPWRRTASFAALLLITTACDRWRDAGEVVVSAIGGDLTLRDPARGPQGFAARVMMDASAQGLVRFDAAGQIEPGIAERWTVIDDGMSYIFRLRDAEWADGQPVTATQVVAVLKRQLAQPSRNPLRPFLSAIDEIVEMTPEVIEVRLNRPRPDLLKLFAQPELAIFRTRPPGGSGPLRIVSRTRSGALLRHGVDPTRSPDEIEADAPDDDVRLIAERAAMAIVRFAAGKSDLVAGGTVADWPLLAQARIAPANRRIDPAAGLFGLVVANRQGFLADPTNRAALAAAIDRGAVTGAILPDWSSVTQLLPEQLDSAAPPTIPAWAPAASSARVQAARDMVASWRAAHPEPLALRIALPAGPGGTLLYAAIGRSLIAIGIRPLRVAPDAQADLRLIDAVAPYDSARWYLATACAPCGEAASAAIEAARAAPDGASRAQWIAEADVALDADAAYIPLARPLRWSLVAGRLTAWQGNPRAWHPLNHLRNAPN